MLNDKLLRLLEFFKNKPDPSILVPAMLKNLKEEAKKAADDSAQDGIIDITGQAEIIRVEEKPRPKPRSSRKSAASEPTPIEQANIDVPAWKGRQIFGLTDLVLMNDEQREFYEKLKAAFADQKSVDLQDNRAYAYCLMYELLRDCQGDFAVVNATPLRRLGRYYPYLMPVIENSINDARKRNNVWYYSRNWYSEAPYRQLHISLAQERWLQYVHRTSDLHAVYIYALEHVRLFLLTLADVENQFCFTSKSLNAHLIDIADLYARKQFRFRKGSSNYQNCTEDYVKNFYLATFFAVDNALREHYRCVAKSYTYYFTDGGVQEIKPIVAEIQEAVDNAITRHLPNAAPLTDEFDIALNQLGTARWQILLADLKASYTGNAQALVQAVQRLCQRGISQSAAENVCLDCARLLAEDNKKEALDLYLHYLHQATKLDAFGDFNGNKKYKPFAQKYLKKFLPNKEHQTQYTAICERMKIPSNINNLQKSLDEVAAFFVVQRKKINIDTNHIQHIQAKHHSTVNLLNQYLADEDEQAANPVATSSSPVAEEKSSPSQQNNFLPTLALTTPQIELLRLFTQHNYSLTSEQVQQFARTQGLMHRPLIEAVNERCYDTLDDLLIEDEGDAYSINPDYFRIISPDA